MVTLTSLISKHATYVILFEKKIPAPPTQMEKKSHIHVFSPTYINEKKCPSSKLIREVRAPCAIRRQMQGNRLAISRT